MWYLDGGFVTDGVQRIRPTVACDLVEHKSTNQAMEFLNCDIDSFRKFKWVVCLVFAIPAAKCKKWGIKIPRRTVA